MHASLVWFTLLAPCIYAAPLPINQIDSLLASISKQISKAIPINNIPTALATKPSTMVRVVVNPKIVPNPKTTPKLVRRSLPAREEPASDHVADVLLVTEDANTLPVNTHQVAFFNASLDASLAPSPAADEPLLPRALKSKSSLAPPPLFTPKIKVPITTTRPVSVPVANPKASKFSLILDVKVVSPLKSHPGAPVPTKSL